MYFFITVNIQISIDFSVCRKYNQKQRYICYKGEQIRVSRLKKFTLNWYDAFHYYFSPSGVSSMLITGKDKLEIYFVIEGENFTIDISDCEDEFIDQLEKCGIKELDNWCFVDTWVCDGDNWSLRITYDNTEICSEGINAYPKPFFNLMKLLHEKGLPFIEYESYTSEKRQIEKVPLDQKWRSSILP
ncbi:MAG: hypothetical protein II589_06855 [Clostridia bacterium]|nr:hypothetical protein [Clostridia bacterium]